MKVMQGTVVSAKNDKTVIVSVTRKWQHPLYKKFVKRTKHYACHVEGMKLVEGDMVTIQECRPISKTKKFKVMSHLKHTVEMKKEEQPQTKAKAKVKKVAKKK